MCTAPGQLARDHRRHEPSHANDPRHFELPADAERMLEKHAQWLRSLREQITKVSRPGSRANSGATSEATPVKVRVGPDRELVIRVQSSAHA
jgi:hypothetical protein